MLGDVEAGSDGPTDIAYWGVLKGSHMKWLMGFGCNDGGMRTESAEAFAVVEEWTPMVIPHVSTIVSP